MTTIASFQKLRLKDLPKEETRNMLFNNFLAETIPMPLKNTSQTRIQLKQSNFQQALKSYGQKNFNHQTTTNTGTSKLFSQKARKLVSTSMAIGTPYQYAFEKAQLSIPSSTTIAELRKLSVSGQHKQTSTEQSSYQQYTSAQAQKYFRTIHQFTDSKKIKLKNDSSHQIHNKKSTKNSNNISEDSLQEPDIQSLNYTESKDQYSKAVKVNLQQRKTTSISQDNQPFSISSFNTLTVKQIPQNNDSTSKTAQKYKSQIRVSNGFSSVKISSQSQTKLKQQQVSKRSATGGTGSQPAVQLQQVQEFNITPVQPKQAKHKPKEAKASLDEIEIRNGCEKTKTIIPDIRDSIDQINPVQEPLISSEREVVQKATHKPTKEASETIVAETFNSFIQELRGREQLCDKLINEEQDYFGALYLYSPLLHDYFLSYTKKLQRKIDTFELKQSMTNTNTVGQQPTQVANIDRVNQELKKQIKCYKEEIEVLKGQNDLQQILDSQQKLITDYNQLYDHYQAAKHSVKKLRIELQQSNLRERTFLQLLRETGQFSQQAEILEQQYDKIFTKDGLTRDPEIGGPGAVVQVNEDVTIPMLNLSIIHKHQEVAAQKENSSSNQTNENYTDSDRKEPITA